MLVQSGGNNVYAVLANTDEFELSIMPTLTIQSTTVILALRCRFKSLQTDYFDPMMVPKSVLVSGIERSKNTLRGTLMLNTGFTVEKVGSGFPDIVAKKLVSEVPGILLPISEEQEKAVLYINHLRDDFATDFAKLVTSVIAPISPAKNFSKVPALLSLFDMGIYMAAAAEHGPEVPFKVVPEPEPAGTGASVKKLDVSGDYEPDPEKIPVDNSEKAVDKPATGKEGSKVHLLGQAPALTPAEPETTD